MKRKRDTAKVGTTLSQVALATRLRRTAAQIRSCGLYVYGTRPGARWHETWARMEFSNQRCAGYRRVA